MREETKARDAKIAALRSQGWTFREIGEAVGCSEETARRRYAETVHSATRIINPRRCRTCGGMVVSLPCRLCRTREMASQGSEPECEVDLALSPDVVEAAAEARASRIASLRDRTYIDSRARQHGDYAAGVREYSTRALFGPRR